MESDGDKDEDCGQEGSPFQRTFATAKAPKSPAERQEVAARVVRIAEQCRERSGSGAADPFPESILPGVASCGAEEDCGEEIKPVIARPVDPVKSEETVIVFDWDDTLFPTWYITEVVRPRLEDGRSPMQSSRPNDPQASNGRAVSSRSNIELPPDSPFAEALADHARKIKVLLQTACAVARVGIVTLSQRPWVISSAKRFLLGLDIEELLKELKIPIVYARESIKRSMVSLAEAEEGVNVFAIAKQRAMAKVLKKLYGKDLGAWRNVISVGDSRIEKDAMKELLWSIDLPDSSIGPPTCKTVKLMEEPSIDQLGAELLLLRMWLPPMASHPEDFDIIMDDSEETMLRLHECFCLSTAKAVR